MRGVVLIGFMGAGKSEVGKALASLTDLEVVDTDALVEAEAGMSVSEIFRSEGEPGFRAREAAAVAAAASGPRRIISCGGGAVLDPRNLATLREAGTVVYLRAAPETLRARLGDGDGRPLLATDDAFDRLLAARLPAYEGAAGIVVDTDGRAPEEIAADIMERLGW